MSKVSTIAPYAYCGTQLWCLQVDLDYKIDMLVGDQTKSLGCIARIPVPLNEMVFHRARTRSGTCAVRVSFFPYC